MAFIFERMVATFRYVSTVGFLVTLADWYGYLGSVSVSLYKNFGQANISFHDFFMYGAYVLAVFYSIMVVGSFLYFRKKHQELLQAKAMAPTVL